MEGERILIDSLNRRFRVKVPVGLSETPPNLRIAKASKPWRIYFRMLGTVLPAFFLMYTSLFMVMGAVELEPILVLSSALCSLPLVFLIFRLHRPRLIHVRLAVPDVNGSEAHALSEGGSLRTPVKTSLSRFLMKDDSILDMPPSRQLWAIFAVIVSIGVILTVLLLQSTTEIVGKSLFILLAIPLWLIGFSLPVLAWWGTSTTLLGLPTRRRDAESWLIAGMASAFPAIIFNSLVAPELIPSSLADWSAQLSLLAIGAPLCEEIFKALAVAIFLPSIKGPKQGFQIGFTVGLGFALIENLQYIGASLFGGPISTTMTILVRGIGSIPAHAVWTAISGTAIGWMATDKKFKARMSWRAQSLTIRAIDIAERAGIDADGDGDLSGFDGARPTLEEAIDSASAEQSDFENSWFLIDPRTGTPTNPVHTTKTNLEGFSVTYDKGAGAIKAAASLSPKKFSLALVLAIAGHSFWNGSSFLSYHAPTEWLGMSEAEGVLVMLAWTLILIVSVLIVARRLLSGIQNLDSDF